MQGGNVAELSAETKMCYLGMPVALLHCNFTPSEKEVTILIEISIIDIISKTFLREKFSSLERDRKGDMLN